MSDYNNLRDLIVFIFDTAHDLEIDDEDMAEDLRTLGRKLKEESE
jgi:hypothetical protein